MNEKIENDILSKGRALDNEKIVINDFFATLLGSYQSVQLYPLPQRKKRK